MYRYYCIMRPPMIGGVPHSRTLQGAMCFDERRYIPEIDRMAWGWIEYDQPITPDEINDYELVEGNSDVLAYIRQLEAERDGLLQKLQQPHANEPQWISAETPPTQTNDKDGYAVNYLIYDPEDGVDIGCYIPEVKTWFCAGMPSNVTHWAPLPQPPKEEEHAENG